MIGIFHKRLLYIVLWSIVITVLVACDSTARAEKKLTETHGAEVRSAIENFELMRRSLEAYKDPRIQDSLVTEPYLSHFGIDFTKDYVHTLTVYIYILTPLSSLEDFRVIEYSSERFKAVGCIMMKYDLVNEDGSIEHSNTAKQCGVYVFIHEDDTWKLAGFFNTTIPQDVWRDWDYAPDWQKEIIGNLPRDLPF